MIRVHQTRGVHTGRTLDFEVGPVRIGRMPGCEVLFDAHGDLDVSGHHAELRWNGVAWSVVDVGSRNGTFVDGARVQRRELKGGEVLEFGHGGPALRVEVLGRGANLAAPDAATGQPTPVRADAILGRDTLADPRVPDPSPLQGVASPSPAPGGIGSPAPAGSAASPVAVAPAGASAPVAPVSRWAPGGAVAGAPASPGAGAPVGPGPQSPMGASPPHQAAPGSPAVGAAGGSADGPGPKAGAKRYGEKTMGLMVQDAVSQAKERGAKVPLGWKIGLGCLGTMLFAATIAVAYLLASHEQSAVPDVAAIASTNLPAIGRLTATQGGVDMTLCTVFAVRTDTLATSARCVLEVERRQGAGVFVKLELAGRELSITQMFRHPEFDPTAGTGPDIGLIRVTGDVAGVASLAEEGEVRPESVVVVYGHTAAGLVATPATVETCGATTLAYRPALPVGAPIFNADGVVIGVHSAPTGSPAMGGGGVRVEALASLLAGLSP